MTFQIFAQWSYLVACQDLFKSTTGGLALHPHGLNLIKAADAIDTIVVLRQSVREGRENMFWWLDNAVNPISNQHKAAPNPPIERSTLLVFLQYQIIILVPAHNLHHSVALDIINKQLLLQMQFLVDDYKVFKPTKIKLSVDSVCIKNQRRKKEMKVRKRCTCLLGIYFSNASITLPKNKIKRPLRWSKTCCATAKKKLLNRIN